jgi:hypothetical protein
MRVTPSDTRAPATSSCCRRDPKSRRSSRNPPVGIEARREAPAPAANRRLVPDLPYLNPTLEQLTSRSLEVRDGEIDVANRSGGLLGEPDTDLDRATRARRRQLHDPERLGRRIVDIERETDSIDIEPHRSINIAHRQRDHFD